jgi:hypothetical protein
MLRPGATKPRVERRNVAHGNYDDRWVLFVDDSTEGLENYEYEIEASSLEQACLLGQEAFPYGIIGAVISRRELDEGDMKVTQRGHAQRKSVQRKIDASSWYGPVRSISLETLATSWRLNVRLSLGPRLFAVGYGRGCKRFA